MSVEQRKAIELIALLSMPPMKPGAQNDSERREVAPAESPMQIRAILANCGALQLFVEKRESDDPEIRA